MPTESAPTPSPLGQRIAGGALVAVCGPIFLWLGVSLVLLLLAPPASGAANNPGSLAYMICFAGLMGLLAAYGLRMILRSFRARPPA
jgi:hypothetical protein